MKHYHWALLITLMMWAFIIGHTFVVYGGE